MNSFQVELSLVIPVFNGSRTIGRLVDEIHQTFHDVPIEIILVNDGSTDDSEQTCTSLVEKYSRSVSLIQLSRNFGEHSAVLAGLNHGTGRYFIVMDDDGQNPPAEARRLLEHIRETKLDVVYGWFVEKKHSWFRNFGSRLNDRMANIMLKKPREIYLSSFKVMNRMIVGEVVKYRGPFPYIDGLIYRATRSIGQIPIEHSERSTGRSGYTLRKLVKLWLNMFLGFSIAPLRLSVLLGLFTSALSMVLLVTIVIEYIITAEMPAGIPTVIVAMTFFAGVQLVVLGTVGEYVGRIFLEQNGMPQYVVRYVKSNSQGPS